MARVVFILLEDLDCLASPPMPEHCHCCSVLQRAACPDRMHYPPISALCALFSIENGRLGASVPVDRHTCDTTQPHPHVAS